MLPSELLAVWKRRGLIWPRYAKLSSYNLEVATLLIQAYGRHLGEKKNVLKGLVNELEDRGYEYRFVRGLSFLLDRRSTFKFNGTVNPVDLRRKIYQSTQKLGLPTTPMHRSQIIETVASELNTTPEMVEGSFYDDLDSELILTEFRPPAPKELLEEYNLSLTQTLLFDSTELNFTSSGNWQRIFYAIKRLGLIYEASQEHGFWVKIDGPISLFKLTRRYGTALAKLLPVIVDNPQWTVEAKILWKYTNEICDFKIESWKHGTFLKKPQLPDVSYDSIVEEDFAARFQALKSGWQLRREPEPVVAGRQVIIPDFSIEREGIKIYMEVVGFWTTEYLLRKIEKLKKVNVKMLIAVNETLACDKLADLKKHAQLNILHYKNTIPLAPILRYLEEAFQPIQADQTSFVKNLSTKFTEPVVNYKEFAFRIGVSAEAVKAAFTDKPPQGYIMMHNGLVSKDKLEQIRKKIEERISLTGRLSFSEAAKIIEMEGVEEASSVLETLGYRILWHGISPEKAEVSKQ
jgi:predicted nuclease of restriction endonuclease-like RecB superfamily